MRRGIYLSNCVRDFIQTVEWPFDGRTACLPDILINPSQKISCYSKGTFSTSAVTGVGFIYINPAACCSNNAVGVAYTDSAFAGTQYAPNPTVGVTFGNTNSPYNNANFQDTPVGVQGRVVAAGILINNVTNRLNIAGTVTTTEHPDHYFLTGADQSNVLAFPTSKVFPSVPGEDVTVVSHQISPADYEYNGLLTGWNTNYYYLGIMANAPSIAGVATVQTFEFQVYVVFEVMGSNVISTTPSHSDPVGMAAYKNATSKMKYRAGVRGDKRSMIASIGRDVLQNLAPVVGGALSGVTDLVDFASAEVQKGLQMIGDGDW